MGVLKDTQRIGARDRTYDTLERRLGKTMEELGELAEAILSVTSSSNAKGKNHMDILEEAVDVAIMGIDIALTKPDDMSLDMSDDEWRQIVKDMFETKLAKWGNQIEAGRSLIQTTNHSPVRQVGVEEDLTGTEFVYAGRTRV